MQKVNQVHVLQTSKVGWTHFGPAHPKKEREACWAASRPNLAWFNLAQYNII